MAFFHCFISHLLSTKWMGMALVTQHIENACQDNMALATEGTTDSSNKMERFSYKGEWVNV